MTEKLEQQIKERIVNLPKEFQEAIGSSDWVKISNEIGKKYLLSDNEINILQLEISLILLQLQKFDYLASKIESEIALNKEISTKISDEIDQKILKPIIEKVNASLKNKIDLKNLDWKQTINFIISGGDYSIFLDDEMGNVNNLPTNISINN